MFRFIQYYFDKLNLHIKFNAGTEFYKKEIVNFILPYLDTNNIKYKILTKNEIDNLVRKTRTYEYETKNIDDDIEKYIKPLNRKNEQYGWYVYIDRVKADFGGVHISLEDSKKCAIEFINNLKKHLAT